MATDTNLPAQGEATHQYASPGVYTVTIADESDASRSKAFTIVIPFGPVMTVREDPTDSTRRSVEITVDNAGEGSVTIDWGDGSARSSNAGDNVEATRHRYANAGMYTITVADADDPTRFTTAEVSVPFTHTVPTLTATPDPADTTGMTVSLLVDNHGAGAVTVDWGDGTATGTNSGDNTTPTTHAYATAGTYTITATDAANSQIQGQGSYVAPTVPTPPPALAASEDTSDTTGMTVSLLVDNHGNGQVTVDWADASAATTNPGDNTTPSTHQYATAGTYPIRATDADDPNSSAAQDVTVPYPTAPAPQITVVADGTDPMQGNLTVDNWAELSPQSATVDWGDGGATEPLTTATATHVYDASMVDVEQTITVTPDGGGTPGTATFTPTAAAAAATTTTSTAKTKRSGKAT